MLTSDKELTIKILQEIARKLDEEGFIKYINHKKYVFIKINKNKSIKIKYCYKKDQSTILWLIYRKYILIGPLSFILNIRKPLQVFVTKKSNLNLESTELNTYNNIKRRLSNIRYNFIIKFKENKHSLVQDYIDTYYDYLKKHYY